MADNRAGIHSDRTIGERVADNASALIGSWKFIIVQTILVLIWLAANITGLVFRWDPFPFILLNLMFSVQAAYTGPILLLAGNRQAAKDRSRDDRDDFEIGTILDVAKELHSMQSEQMNNDKVLYDLQNEQLASHTKQLRLLNELVSK